MDVDLEMDPSSSFAIPSWVKNSDAVKKYELSLLPCSAGGVEAPAGADFSNVIVNAAKVADNAVSPGPPPYDIENVDSVGQLGFCI